MSVRPFVDKARADVEDWTLWHEHAEVTVEYGVPRDDQEMQSVSGETDGPGGEDGATDGEDVTFVSQKTSFGGEYLTYPADGTQWEDDAAEDPEGDSMLARTVVAPKFGTVLFEESGAGASEFTVRAFNVPTGRGIKMLIDGAELNVKSFRTNPDRTVRVVTAEPLIAGHAAGTEVDFYSPVAAAKAKRGVSDNVPTAVIIPTLEHTIDWNYVAAPPWAAIRATMGKVNVTKFSGCARETCLFLGAETSRDRTSKGTSYWKMSYKFAEKNVNPSDVTDPIGWNHVLRPDGDKAGSFQRLSKFVPPDAEGNPPTGVLTGLTSTTFTVSNPQVFPKGTFCVKIGTEIVQANAYLGSGVFACTRGLRGTSGGAGASAVQTASGLYDVARFRYLFISG
jgi:hypothetical protein